MSKKRKSPKKTKRPSNIKLSYPTIHPREVLDTINSDLKRFNGNYDMLLDHYGKEAERRVSGKDPDSQFLSVSYYYELINMVKAIRVKAKV